MEMLCPFSYGADGVRDPRRGGVPARNFETDRANRSVPRAAQTAVKRCVQAPSFRYSAKAEASGLRTTAIVPRAQAGRGSALARRGKECAVVQLKAFQTAQLRKSDGRANRFEARNYRLAEGPARRVKRNAATGRRLF